MRMGLEELESRMLLSSNGLELPVDPSADDTVGVEVGDIGETETDGNDVVLEFGDPGSDGNEIMYFTTAIESCGDRIMRPIDWVDDDSIGGDAGDVSDSSDDGSEDVVDEPEPGDDIAVGFRVIAPDDGESSDKPVDGEETGEEIFCPMIYTLGGTAAGDAPDSQGPDELEPNDTFDTATFIDLQPLPTFAPGVSLFGADVQGIAGGDANDQDVFAFHVEAGHHVSMGVEGQVTDGDETFGSVDEWIFAKGLNEFGDSADTAYTGGTPLFNEATGETIDRLAYIVSNHPDLIVGHAIVAVYDADGNAVAKSGADARSFGIEFDSDAGGTYYAVVSMDESSSSGDLVPYRLGIMAQSGFDIRYVLRGDSGESVEPKVILLHGGETYDFKDSDGDDVEINFLGRGKATITFSGSRANGSDIVSVVIQGGRRGQLTVLSDSGSADVGSIEISGSQGRTARRGGAFGRIEVDGNLGSFTSDLNVRQLVVDGMLGDVAATGTVIGRLRADMFDTSTVDEESIVKLHVKEDSSADIMRHMLSWV
jgi:hypothetical protein